MSAERRDKYLLPDVRLSGEPHESFCTFDVGPLRFIGTDFHRRIGAMNKSLDVALKCRIVDRAGQVAVKKTAGSGAPQIVIRVRIPHQATDFETGRCKGPATMPPKEAVRAADDDRSISRTLALGIFSKGMSRRRQDPALNSSIRRLDPHFDSINIRSSDLELL